MESDEWRVENGEIGEKPKAEGGGNEKWRVMSDECRMMNKGRE